MTGVRMISAFFRLKHLNFSLTVCFEFQVSF